MRRLAAAVLCLAVGWPMTATAAPGAEPEPADPDATRAEPPPGTEPEPAPSPEDELSKEPSPEEIARRRFEMKLEDAETHWQEGDRLYSNGQYAEAAVEFERSYSAVPAASALYSAALSYERGGMPVDAVRTLERYLALDDCTKEQLQRGDLYCTAQRAEAEQARAEQMRRIGRLRLELGEGVELREVKVAGRSVPLEDFPLLLVPGTVDVEVFGMGPDEHRSRPATIAAGETYALYVAPFDAPAGPTAVPPGGGGGGNQEVDLLQWEQRQRQLRTAFWVGTGLTAAAGIALAITGGLALYHQRSFREGLCSEQCFPVDENGDPIRDEQGNIDYYDMPYPADHEAAVERYRPLANGMLGATIGLGVATALVGAFAFRKYVPPAGPTRARAHVRLGGSGLIVRW